MRSEDRLVERVEDLNLCARCGGLCCKRAPGRYSPDDFADEGGVSVAVITRALEGGNASINTSFITVPGRKVAPLFTVAARGVRKPELSLCDGEMKCARVSSSGCDIELDERPFECAAMVPHTQIAQCLLPDGMTMEELWIPYQDILREVIEQWSQKKWFDELHEHIFTLRGYDAYKTGARELINAIGMASDPREIDQILSVWQNQE
jgi:hypothetical protein